MMGVCSKSHACLLLSSFFLVLLFSSSYASELFDNLSVKAEDVHGVAENAVNGAVSVEASNNVTTLPSPQVQAEGVHGVADHVVSGTASVATPGNLPSLPKPNEVQGVAKEVHGVVNGGVDGAASLGQSQNIPNVLIPKEVVAGVDAVGNNPTVRSLPAQFNGAFSWGQARWGSWKSLMDGQIKLAEGNETLILAAERTDRKDPSDENKRYKGGWNIFDTHYLASVAFTGAPLFVIAIVWFLVFGLALLLICCCFCCCRRKPYGYSRLAYAFSLIFLMLFTVLAIIGAVFLYTGQGKFFGSTKDIVHYVQKQANFTFDNLRNVSNEISLAKGVQVHSIVLPDDAGTKIDQVAMLINSTVNYIGEIVDQSADLIQTFLDKMTLSLSIIATTMLLLAFIGFLLSVLGLQPVVYILVIIGWILVAGTFILCGIFLVLHNIVGDTCVALDEWVQYPAARTALSQILPCVDAGDANQILLRTKEVSHDLVGIVNGVLLNVSNIDYLPVFFPLYYNQSGPLVPKLCNPFNDDMTDRVCAPGEVDFDNATLVWQNYVCPTTKSGVCTTPGRLTQEMYIEMSTAANVSAALYRYSPFLIGLIDCTFVRETFTGINNNNCPGLEKYSKWTYAGLAIVSTAVMLSLVFWIIYARERRHRVYTKKIDGTR